MCELISVIGFPGAGKSTHSERLVGESLGGKSVIHASIGNRLRSILANRTDSQFGDIIRATSPRPLSNDIILGALFELIPPDNSIVGLIDGFPRHADKVEPFLDYVAQTPHRLLGCLSLEVGLETSVERVKQRSHVETERSRPVEHITQRYLNHIKESTAVIGQLNEHIPIMHIDASQDVDVVWQSFSEAALSLISQQATRA